MKGILVHRGGVYRDLQAPERYFLGSRTEKVDTQ